MKQVAQNYRTGELRVLDVPAPACRPGGVLVRSRYSLISTGTELMKVGEARMSLAAKARARPDQVRKVLDSAAQQGVRSAYAKAMQRLDSYTALGYSVCGYVVEAGRGAEELPPGRLVACAGNEFALHAEVNWVPLNLCVPVPDGVEPRLAAFATVGAVALHGVRRAAPQLGDTACVVGLGLVGQLVVQLLVAAGVHAVGVDVVPGRCQLAEKAGARACGAPHAEGLARVEHALADLSGGLGADHVFVTAGGTSSGPVEVAARLARDRGRVVDVGKVKMALPWNAYYEKELDVRFSRSYGPGRYDDRYELEGVDYPPGYVRWTERRNLSCFLDLAARGTLSLDLLASQTFAVEEAPDVYARLRAGELEGVGFLFEYPRPDAPGAPGPAAAPVRTTLPPRRTSAAPGATPGSDGAPKLRLGVVGAGSYASSALLPHLAGRDDVELVQVVTNTSLSAANAQRRFGFARATTDAARLFESPEIDAVLIATRHHDHAELVCRSLEAGKATFVEKPLALSGDELDQVVEVVRSTGNDRLMVGFNRRFAPLLADLRHRFGESPAGTAFRYLVTAGPLPAGSWYRNEHLEGSRFAGEGGHFLDTIGWWMGGLPVELQAIESAGTLHVVVHYEQARLGTIDYVTGGSPRFPKETFDVSAPGRSARFENFSRATVWHGRRRRTRRALVRDKGQQHELAQFVGAVRSGSPMPIPLSSLVSTTAATLAVGRSLAAGSPVPL